LHDIQLSEKGCTAVDPNVGLNYENAFSHLKECEYEKYMCPFDCHLDKNYNSSLGGYQGYYRSELDDHYKTCPLSTERC